MGERVAVADVWGRRAQDPGRHPAALGSLHLTMEGHPEWILGLDVRHHLPVHQDLQALR